MYAVADSRRIVFIPDQRSGDRVLHSLQESRHVVKRHAASSASVFEDLAGSQCHIRSTDDYPQFRVRGGRRGATE